MRKYLTLGFDRNDLRFTYNLFRMNVRDRYLGSLLGGIWAFANPAALFAIYTVVFGFVFKSRIPGAESSLGFAIWLIAGYGAWLAIMESLNSSTQSVVGAAGMVKNMTFKTEVLPIAAAFTGLLPLLVSLIFMSTLLVIDGNYPTWHALLIIPNVVVHFSFVVALGMHCSVINVFSRDFGFALPSVLIMILFASPIFYQISSMPRPIQKISFLNPFYIICESYRQVFLFHKMPDPIGMLYVFGISVALFLIGLRFFRRAKGHFDSAL